MLEEEHEDLEGDDNDREPVLLGVDYIVIACLPAGRIGNGRGDATEIDV
jgi:hypothetical protein